MSGDPDRSSRDGDGADDDLDTAPTSADADPFRRDDDRHRAFWADAVADRIEDRDPDDPVVIKGGVSPSGTPHIGHVNEVMRGYYVAQALRERGHRVRQVFTSDDRDPLRSIPHRLTDLDWNTVERGGFDVGALGRNLGRPLTDVPDPFGCCSSFGAHQTELLERSFAAMGVPVEVTSATEMYESGRLEPVTRELLRRRDLAREVLADYQDGVDEDGDYVPFWPRCESCGMLTDGVVDVDLADGTVEYVCSEMEAGDRTIEGCGHRGRASLRDGKIPWRFEWPAQWSVLDVDFEPFGKDHAEGSWPSGVEITERVLGERPPEPMVYEWFSLDGAALSSSSGNVITVPEVLELVEADAFRYFFARNPRKARDFSVASVDDLVDEFDRFERAFYRESPHDERRRELADRAYPHVIDPGRLPEGAVESAGDPESVVRQARAARDGEGDPPVGPDAYDRYRDFFAETFRHRVRIPYRFAAVLGMTDDPAIREEIARREGHLPDDAPEWAVDLALARIEGARAWASRTGNRYDYRIVRESVPDHDLPSPVEDALDDLAAFVADLDSAAANGDGGRPETGDEDDGDADEAADPGEALQSEFYRAAERHDVEPADLFAAGYRLFFDDEEGPRLGEFLADLDRQFVVDRLRRES